MQHRNDQILALLHNDDFVQFASRMIHDYIDWDTFKDLPMPSGLDAQSTWEILAALRRILCVPTIATRDHTGINRDDIWYDVSPTMHALLADIVYRTNEASALSRSLSKRLSQGFIIQPLIDEIIAGAKRDGLTLDYESVRSLMKSRRAPETQVEVLLANVYNIFLRLDHYKTRRFSHEFFNEIYTTITAGVEDATSVPLERTRISYQWQPSTSQDVLLLMEENYLNYEESNIHPIIAAISSSDVIWEFCPYAQWNGLLEVVLRALYLNQIGCPALAYIPFSQMNLLWESGELGHDLAHYTYGDAHFDSQFGIDVTPYFIQKIEFIVAGIQTLENIIFKLDERDSCTKAALERDYRLNHRQRYVLGKMVDNPEVAFDIASYARQNSVVRATARADLERLVEMDFVYSEHQGKKLVFKARPNLVRAIRSTYR